MPNIVSGFTSLTDQPHDLLSPVEFRTIVEMLQGILNSYQFKKLAEITKIFQEHLDTPDPLYENSGINFEEKFTDSVYATYIKMIANPLNLADFRSQIVNTIGFVELVRRIVLNQYLYDQLKSENGSIAVGSYQVNLTDDWQVSGSYPNPVTITIVEPLADQTAFIRLGWNGNTAPLPVVFTAQFLSLPTVNLPIIYTGDYDTTFTAGVVEPITLPLSSNDFTFSFTYQGTPSVLTTVATFSNSEDQLVIKIDTDRRIVITFNNIVVQTSATPSANNHFVVEVDKRGYLTLKITTPTAEVISRIQFIFNNLSPLSDVTLPLSYASVFSTEFAAKNAIIYQGAAAPPEQDNIIVPLGYALMMWPDGSCVVDRDGVPLVDVNIEEGADRRGRFAYVLDRDGSFLMDATGAFYVVDASTYGAIVDTDGKFVVDTDGSYLVELDEPQE